jgi:hypothetical protein
VTRIADYPQPRYWLQLVASAVLGLFALLFTLGGVAQAHYENGTFDGYHYAGAAKTLAGGFGVRFAIEVSDTGIGSANGSSFVRGRVALRKSNSDPWMQTGWQQDACQHAPPCSGGPPPRFFTQKQNGPGVEYPNIAIDTSGTYRFRVVQTTYGWAEASVYYGTYWRALDATSETTGQCVCYERAGIEVYLDSAIPCCGLPSDWHPNMGGNGVQFGTGDILKSDGSWVTWDTNSYPQASTFVYNPQAPYNHCNDTEWYRFTIVRGSC